MSDWAGLLCCHVVRQTQRCHSTEPYFVQLIPSRTDSSLIYEVHSVLPEDLPNEYVCSCPGFRFNGSCAHQSMAFSDRCLWSELEGPETQTPTQQKASICPRCGQPTVKETIDD